MSSAGGTVAVIVGGLAALAFLDNIDGDNAISILGIALLAGIAFLLTRILAALERSRQ